MAMADAEVAKDFLLWARREGFAFETLHIGRVQLFGARDLCPSIASQVHAVSEQERHEARDVGAGSAYDDMPGADHFLGKRPQ